MRSSPPVSALSCIRIIQPCRQLTSLILRSMCHQLICTQALLTIYHWCRGLPYQWRGASSQILLTTLRPQISCPQQVRWRLRRSLFYSLRAKTFWKAKNLTFCKVQYTTGTISRWIQTTIVNIRRNVVRTGLAFSSQKIRTASKAASWTIISHICPTSAQIPNPLLYTREWIVKWYHQKLTQIRHIHSPSKNLLSIEHETWLSPNSCLLARITSIARYLASVRKDLLKVRWKGMVPKRVVIKRSTARTMCKLR